MKIRYCFISNSSSSAFVIKIKDLTLEQLYDISKAFPNAMIFMGEVKVRLSQPKKSAGDTLSALDIPLEIVNWTNVE